MEPFDYTRSPVPIRPDLGAAHGAFWAKLAGPGDWWTGEQRVAIARESRNALRCALCAQRKRALSPYADGAAHDHDGDLSELAVDAVHRVVTDASRITRNWVDENAAAGLSKEAYVELVGVVVAVFSIDEFHRALGLEVEALPSPRAGAIRRHRPAVLSEDIGFVPTVPPEGAVGSESDLWEGNQTANVLRALTLVPDALRDWRGLCAAQYLSFEGMQNFGKHEGRAIDRLQMELIAARVSAVNECFY